MDRTYIGCILLSFDISHRRIFKPRSPPSIIVDQKIEEVPKSRNTFETVFIFREQSRICGRRCGGDLKFHVYLFVGRNQHTGKLHKKQIYRIPLKKRLLIQFKAKKSYFATKLSLRQQNQWGPSPQLISLRNKGFPYDAILDPNCKSYMPSFVDKKQKTTMSCVWFSLQNLSQN